MSNLDQKLKKMGRLASIALVIIGIALLVIEVFVHRHGEITMEDLPVFPAVFAFVASVFIVVISIGIRAILSRREDYYD